MAVFFGRQPEAQLSSDVLTNNDIPSPEVQAMLLNNQTMITEKDIHEAQQILQRYKQGKANLEDRVVKDELWWELRHWEAIGKKVEPNTPQPSSAWLFNAILNKHADFMDNYPEPVVLPRERSDVDSAKVLQSVVPVIMEQNEFEQTYSDNCWDKLKHGTSVYGVFWNQQKENGIGDIDIKPIDLLKIFWEPGITDIQKSKNLFIVDLVDNDTLDEMYPQFKGKMKGNAVDVAEYIYDDNIDNSEKSVVVDWYYKRNNPNGQTVVHLVKFVNDVLLYASENDPNYQMEGFYNHGLYPVVFDCLFPEKGTPVGFGYVAICKEPQLYIDKLSANILESSLINTKKRFFASDSTDINVDEFLDWNKPIVHVQGQIDDTRLKEIVCSPMSQTYMNVVEQKIEELKDTAANRDVNSGGVGSGVTAAAAIAALQEAGNKASRDMIAASYRCDVQIIRMCIELIRQFYTEERSFRITAPNGPNGYDFVSFSNKGLIEQPIMDGNGMPLTDNMGSPFYRKPVFDLKIKAQKKNPFSRMEQNEYAKEFYSMGFFSPKKAQESLIALSMMDFEGIEDIKEQVSKGQTLYNMLLQITQQMGMINPTQPQQAPTSNVPKPNTNPQMTAYGQRLAERSMPDMNRG